VIVRLLRVCLGLIPPALAIAALWLMPSATQTPLLFYLAGQPVDQLRLDPLAIAAAAAIALGTAWPRSSLLGSLRFTVGVICMLGALASAAPIVQLAFLFAITGVLVGSLGPRWYLALTLLVIGQLLPLLSTPGGLLPIAAGMAGVPAIGLATLIGIGIVPWPPRRPRDERWEFFLRPIWLVPLMHTLQAGPWPTAWILLLLLTAGAGMASAVAGTLSTIDRRQGSERLLTMLLLMAHVSITVGSAAGIVAALWVILAHSLLLRWTRGATHKPPPIISFALIFPAPWWAGGAAAGTGAFLLAGGLWLAGTVSALASILWQDMAAGTAPSRGRAFLGRLGWLAGVIGTIAIVLLMPALTGFAMLPVADQLDPGLTSFGLLDHWPWIGAAILDAAHRRVALLPVGVLAPLFAVLLAAVWLLSRLVVRGRVEDSVVAPDAQGTWGGVRAHVWWIARRRGG
jgi:hypothetical protein